MPIVRVEMLKGRTQDAKQRVAAEITEVIAKNFGSDPSHVYVMFSELPPEDWAVAGRFFPSQPQSKS